MLEGLYGLKPRRQRPRVLRERRRTSRPCRLPQPELGRLHHISPSRLGNNELLTLLRKFEPKLKQVLTNVLASKKRTNLQYLKTLRARTFKLLESQVPST
jgi:hypothetical protein